MIFFKNCVSIVDTRGGGFVEIESLLDSIETRTLVGCIISFRNSDISFCNIEQKFINLISLRCIITVTAENNYETYNYTAIYNALCHSTFHFQEMGNT